LRSGISLSFDQLADFFGPWEQLQLEAKERHSVARLLSLAAGRPQRSWSALSVLQLAPVLDLVATEDAKMQASIAQAYLRCTAAELALHAISAILAEGLLPTTALVFDRTRTCAQRQKPAVGLRGVHEGLGLLLSRGWLREESSPFYTCLRPVAEVTSLWAEHEQLQEEARERSGVVRLLALAAGK